MFAATPPLEAIEMLLSLAVTEGVGYTRNNESAGMKLEFIDVKRAYFHAPAKRDVYVRLPNEMQRRVSAANCSSQCTALVTQLRTGKKLTRV